MDPRFFAAAKHVFKSPFLLLAIAIIWHLTLQASWVARILFTFVAYDVWIAFISFPEAIERPDRVKVVIVGE
jgi:hypothetical protein